MHRAIPVLYEDEWFMILEKPPGLLTVPAGGQAARTLADIAQAELTPARASYRLYPCHRLDRETSGAIIFAKGKAAQQEMMDLFRQHRVRKVYAALVHGNPPQDEGVITHPIEGKPASTRYRVLQRYREYCFLEVEPETGRTNQIRIHFRLLGYPLVGETKFAFRRDFALKARRVMLHARGVAFKHPFTGEPVCVRSELARDFQAFLASHP